jgi:PTH1 family peptidyl-tRNA hydrolase
MNRSGESVRPFIKTEDDCARLIVVHDDIDLPAGTVRVVFDRGSGGHNGVRSIEAVLKTRAFCRVRIGVLPITEAGVLEKPKAGTEVEEFILRPLRGTARTDLEQCAQKAHEVLLMLMEEGREKTMRAFHAPKEPVKKV